MKFSLFALSSLAFSAATTGFLDFPEEIQQAIVDLASPSSLPTFSMTSKENSKRVKAYLLETNIMRKDHETGQLHPDYSHPCWSLDEDWKKKALVQFPVSPDNNLIQLYHFGPTITESVGSDPTSKNDLSIVKLLNRGGYVDFIMRLIREKGLKLWSGEISAILLSAEFCEDQILEILDSIDDRMIIDKADIHFAAYCKLISSMMRGNFKEEDLESLLEEDDSIHLCFIHCFIKYHQFELFSKTLVDHGRRWFDSSLNLVFTQHRLFDGITDIQDCTVKKKILNWLADDPNGEIVRLYLADACGHGVLDASATQITENDYHLFSVIFGSSPLGERFAKDMKSDLLTVTPGSKTLLQTLRDCDLSELGYRRLVKGISHLFEHSVGEEMDMLITNSKTLLLAFKGLKNEADNRVLVRELVLDEYIPYEVKRRVIPVLGAIQKPDFLPLIRSLVSLGASADQLMLTLDLVINESLKDYAWEYVELLVGHPHFIEMASYIFLVQIKKHNGTSDLLIQVESRLSSPAFTIRPIFAAIGRAIIQCAGDKEKIGVYLWGLSSVQLTILLPLLFTGILTDEEIDKLHDSRLNRPALPRFQ